MILRVSVLSDATRVLQRKRGEAARRPMAEPIGGSTLRVEKARVLMSAMRLITS